MKKNKVVTKYDAIDLGEIITNMFLNIETPEGARFKALQVAKDIVTININGKTFIVSISEKSKLN
jgi:hypothetical protein